jgi:hypothetical protein
MEKTFQIQNIAKALSSFQEECPVLTLDREVEVKTKSGGSYKFKYSTYKNIVETTRPFLAKNQLSFTHLIDPDGTVTTVLLHPSGETLSSSLTLKGEQTPQGIGSCISYAKRYTLSGLLGLTTEDDDDANIAEGNSFQTADDNRKWLNKGTADYSNAVKKLADGTVKIGDIEKHYKLSKTVRQSLITEAASFQPA